MNRRQLLEGAFAGMLLRSLDGWARFESKQELNLPVNSKQIGQLDFMDEARVPMGKPFGQELDGRQYTDLSQLTPAHDLTPTEEFYIRTRASDLLTPEQTSVIEIQGLVQRSFALKSETLVRSAKPMGAHLMECAGNARVIHFGLMSVAEWSGVPIASLLGDFKAKPEATGVLIAGFDTYRTESRSSMPGASWVFTFDDLRSSNAFLATEMNGQPLSRDHGSPIRLVVPGWYGCASIKWVNAIRVVDDKAASTTQMLEFASRTLQESEPQLARDYRPARIEQAAMPIRVEKWRLGENIRYVVTGILWGGTEPVKALEIQFNPDEEYVPVTSFKQERNDPWSFWRHTWQPKQPGKYAIHLRVREPRLPSRRMDSGFYVRRVEIKEI